MKQMLTTITLVIVVSSFASGQTQERQGSTPATQTAVVEQELLRVERAWLDAYVQRDAAALSRIVADDYMITYGSGQTYNKAQTMADFERPRPANFSYTFTTEDTVVRVLGETAVLTGIVIQRTRMGERETVTRSRYTDTYVRRGGRWQVVASHLSRLPVERTAITTLTPAVLDLYVGEYELGPNRTVVVTREGNSLFAQSTGQQRFELLPESETHFFLRGGADLQTVFVRDSAGRVTHLVIHQDRQNMRVARKLR